MTSFPWWEFGGSTFSNNDNIFMNSTRAIDYLISSTKPVFLKLFDKSPNCWLVKCNLFDLGFHEVSSRFPRNSRSIYHNNASLLLKLGNRLWLCSITITNNNWRHTDNCLNQSEYKRKNPLNRKNRIKIPYNSKPGVLYGTPLTRRCRNDFRSVCIAIFYEPKRIFIDFHCPFACSLVSGWRRANAKRAVA